MLPAFTRDYCKHGEQRPQLTHSELFTQGFFFLLTAIRPSSVKSRQHLKTETKGGLQRSGISGQEDQGGSGDLQYEHKDGRLSFALPLMDDLVP